MQFEKKMFSRWKFTFIFSLFIFTTSLDCRKWWICVEFKVAKKFSKSIIAYFHEPDSNWCLRHQFCELFDVPSCRIRFYWISKNWHSKKTEVFNSANSQYFFAKISGIGPWVSRIIWCNGHQCGSDVS